jgi:hypothetical protein
MRFVACDGLDLLNGIAAIAVDGDGLGAPKGRTFLEIPAPPTTEF